MIGDTHILCIINNLCDKPMRFNELQRAINGLNPTTLSDRLKKLEKEKIIARKEEANDRIAVSYQLTEKGRAILPIIAEIDRFAKKYI